MLLKHEFDPIKHLYTVPGEFVLSVSAIKELNGLSDLSQVPRQALEFAGHRGSAVHSAIAAYEIGQDVNDTIREYERANDCDVMFSALERMVGYYRFRDRHELTLVGKSEETFVYRHAGTEQLIGGTPDTRAMIDDMFFVVDIKTSHRNYGQKAKQDMLAWKAQLQPYQEILTEVHQKTPHKGLLHLHPGCGKERGKEPLGYEFHTILSDDSHLFDSMVRVAMAKISHGHRLESREASSNEDQR